jgi:glycosyltransferase involved in cell wall biosynthesis
MKERNLLMAVYSSVEYYPPSLNALTNLSVVFDKISILSRNVKPLEWNYTSNVANILSGEFTPIREVEQKPMYWKVISFLRYTWEMWKIIKNQNPQVVILYDPIPTLSYYLISLLSNKKHFVWYHNHDVVEMSQVRKYSVNWWAAKIEKKLFQSVNIFSLPAQERKAYFDLSLFNGKYYFIPNVPAITLYKKFYTPKTLQGTIKLIYQGTIAKGHGLEEIITTILPQKIKDKPLELHLKGVISESYKTELLQLAATHGVANVLVFHGFGAYQDVPKIASECHIGIAIHTKTDTMTKTLGTSSNKIYEYAAVGLPILLYDNRHFREHLEKYDWAYFTDLSEESLKSCLTAIVNNYPTISAQAHEDFLKELNFESYFLPVLKEIEAALH